MDSNCSETVLWELVKPEEYSQKTSVIRSELSGRNYEKERFVFRF